MNHSTKKPTKAQQSRLDAIHSMPCCACRLEEEFAKKRGDICLAQPSRTEAHHLVDKGYRIHSGGHDATLNLCGWHHRGDVRGCQVLCNPPTMANVEKVYGPSLATNKKAFIAKYGTERELLEQTNAELESAVAA